jgi:hypothetical protein
MKKVFSDPGEPERMIAQACNCACNCSCSCACNEYVVDATLTRQTTNKAQGVTENNPLQTASVR